ncbi:MAG: hypothetical protein IT342_08120 [Candidatus Melainabacteria bacterium]|nr:hypothetical protein [Candidatus Melainabacteria bacterium]
MSNGPARVEEKTPEKQQSQSSDLLKAKTTDRDSAVSRMVEEVGAGSDDKRPLIGRYAAGDANRSEWDERLEKTVESLDKNSPVYKYAFAGAQERNAVLKAILNDCRSGDSAKQQAGGESLKQIMFLEALSGLDSAHGKKDGRSQTERSFAINLLVGQERSAAISQSQNPAHEVLLRLEQSGDRGVKEKIADAREAKNIEVQQVVELVSQKFDAVRTGRGAEVAAAVEDIASINTMQMAEGNNMLAKLDSACRKILSEQEKLQDASCLEVADARPTAPRQGKTADGTLVLPSGEPGAYKQFQVRDGAVLDAGGKKIGSMEDNGKVYLEKQAPLVISDCEGAAFHGVGSDGARLSLVGGADRAKFTGVIASPDGKESFTVTAGNMFDRQGKMLGRISCDGALESNENGLFQSRSLSAFRDGYHVLAEENGKRRDFVTSAFASNGFVTLKDSRTGQATRYDVRMGMLIDSGTGEQSGWVNPPSEAKDGKLQGGSIVTMKDGHYKETPLAAEKGAVFSLKSASASGHEAVAIEGISSGNQLFNIGEAKRQELTVKRQSQDCIQRIKGSEQGWMGTFNLKWVTGMNASEKAELARKSAAADANFDDFNRLLEGKSSNAEIDRLKDLRNSTHKALYGDAQNKSEAPAKIEIPQLISKEAAASVNGQLRLVHQVFTIKNGQLFEKGNEAAGAQGILRPGYMIEMGGAEQKRVIDLARQNNVLMEFTSNVHEETAQLIGMGAGHMTGGVGYQDGGLIDVRNLSQQARMLEMHALNGNSEYFANRPYLTGGLANWAMGDREATLKEFGEQLHSKVGLLDSSMQNLFKSGFDLHKAPQDMLNGSVCLAQTLMHITGAQSSAVQVLSKEGQQIQAQVNEGVAMAAITVATCGAVNPAFAAMAKAGHLARVGAAGAVALELGACAGTGAVISGVVRASDKSSTLDNMKAGAVEGLLNGAGLQGGKLLASLDEAKLAVEALKKGQALSPAAQKALSGLGGKILNVGATAAPAASPEAVAMAAKGTYFTSNAFMQSLGYNVADSLKNGRSVTSNLAMDKLFLSAAANLVGNYAGLKMSNCMNSQAVLGKELQTALSFAGKKTFANELVSNMIESMTATGTEAIHANLAEQEKNNPGGQKNYLQALSQSLESAAISGLTSTVLTVASRPANAALNKLIERNSAKPLSGEQSEAPAGHGSEQRTARADAAEPSKTVTDEQAKALDRLFAPYDTKLNDLVADKNSSVIAMVGDGELNCHAQALYLAGQVKNITGTEGGITHFMIDMNEKAQPHVDAFINGKIDADELRAKTNLTDNEGMFHLLNVIRLENGERVKSGSEPIGVIAVKQEILPHWTGVTARSVNSQRAMDRIGQLEARGKEFKVLYLSDSQTLADTQRKATDERNFARSMDGPRQGIIDYAYDLQSNRSANDNRADSLIARSAIGNEPLDRNALDVLAVSPKATIEDALAFVSKTDPELAKKLMDRILIMESEALGQGNDLRLAIANAEMGHERKEVLVARLLTASEEFGTLNYRMAMHEIVGHLGMDGWMKKDPEKSAILTQVKDAYDRMFNAQKASNAEGKESKSLLTGRTPEQERAYLRSPAEIAAETVATAAVYKRLLEQAASLEQAGKAVRPETKKAIEKLSNYMNELDRARRTERPADKKLAAVYDRYYECLDEYIRLSFGR